MSIHMDVNIYDIPSPDGNPNGKVSAPRVQYSTRVGLFTR